MPKASVKRLIEKKKDKLINFVLDIEKYPEFIPFCLGSKVYERKEKENFILIVADLTIGKGPFNDTYKSDVKYNKKDDTIFVTNIDGPLKYLKNNWKFVEINEKTEVHFEVDFEIKNSFLNSIMKRSFEYGLNKIADAFQKRAESI
tara:strand:+ start:15 stop:452 length:438 start_codon:yes stop_codon:yes gene_type:complete